MDQCSSVCHLEDDSLLLLLLCRYCPNEMMFLYSKKTTIDLDIIIGGPAGSLCYGTKAITLNEYVQSLKECNQRGKKEELEHY